MTRCYEAGHTIGKQICAFSFGWPENLEVAPVGLEPIEALHAAGELGERQLVNHDELKAACAKARVPIRTGECRLYSNIALTAGVTF